MTTEGIRPFSCGTQYGDWTESNCTTCTKARPNATTFEELTCEIERALSEAYVTDGRIPLPVADQMGHGDGRYVWPCMAHDPPFKNVRADGTVDPSVKRPEPLNA
jgi:hypothetical protein